MGITRHITIHITIEDSEYFADDDAADEWARRLMSRICDLRMAEVINTMDKTVHPLPTND